MKLIAIRDFANVPSLQVGKGSDGKFPVEFPHENHVPKGYKFSIGTGETIEGLKASDKETIAALLGSKAVIIDNEANSKKVAAVLKEAAQEKADAKIKSEAPAAKSLGEQIADGIAAALIAAGITPKKA